MQRLRDAADERRVLLQLSAAGRALKARAVAVPQAAATATGCGLDEVAQLTSRLHALRQQIQVSNPRAA